MDRGDGRDRVVTEPVEGCLGQLAVVADSSSVCVAMNHQALFKTFL